MDIKTALEKLGRQDLQPRLGLVKQSMSAAVTSGAFPASWYIIVQELAEEKGIDVPDSLFNFKKAAQSEVSQ